jgi:hypothetical protein
MTDNRLYRDQLEQIFQSKTKDEDLVNPDERDKLVMDGLVETVDGYNIITSDGVRAFIMSNGSTIDAVNRPDAILLLARVAARRTSVYSTDPVGMGVFDPEQFMGVVNDILSLSNVGTAGTCFILSGRKWLGRLDGGSVLRWKIDDSALQELT